MKLTEEQVKQAFENWLESPEGLESWLASYEFPDTPTECMWIWGGDRLPTNEEMDIDNYIICFSPEKRVSSFYYYNDDKVKELFWTPTPKHLKKPEPPDPFEVWFKQTDIAANAKHEPIYESIAKRAFLAGQQSQNK